MPTFRRAHPQADWRACRPDVPSCSAAPGSLTAGLVAAGVGIEQGVLPRSSVPAGRPRAQRRGRRHPRRRAGPRGRRAPSSPRRAAACETGWSIIRPPGVGDRPPSSWSRCTGWAPTTSTLTVAGVRARPLPGGARRRTADAVRGRRRRTAARRYWHPRRAARTPARMVTDELLPTRSRTRLRHVAVRTDRLVDGRVRRAPTRRPARPGASVGGRRHAARRCGPTRTMRPLRVRGRGGVRRATASSTARPTSPASRSASTSAPATRSTATCRTTWTASRTDARRHEHLRAGRAHARLLAPDAAGPARLPGEACVTSLPTVTSEQRHVGRAETSPWLPRAVTRRFCRRGPSARAAEPPGHRCGPSVQQPQV